MARNPARDLATKQQQLAGLHEKREKLLAAVEACDKAIEAKAAEVAAFDGVDAAVNAETATAAADGEGA